MAASSDSKVFRIYSDHSITLFRLETEYPNKLSGCHVESILNAKGLNRIRGWNSFVSGICGIQLFECRWMFKIENASWRIGWFSKNVVFHLHRIIYSVELFLLLW